MQHKLILLQIHHLLHRINHLFLGSQVVINFQLIKIIIHFLEIILIHILILDMLCLNRKNFKKEVQLIWKNSNYNKRFYNI
nr:MAG TPA: hypothetical protein [Caudoviricetes sp.]